MVIVMIMAKMIVIMSTIIKVAVIVIVLWNDCSMITAVLIIAIIVPIVIRHPIIVVSLSKKCLYSTLCWRVYQDYNFYRIAPSMFVTILNSNLTVYFNFLYLSHSYFTDSAHRSFCLSMINSFLFLRILLKQLFLKK